MDYYSYTARWGDATLAVLPVQNGDMNDHFCSLTTSSSFKHASYSSRFITKICHLCVDVYFENQTQKKDRRQSNHFTEYSVIKSMYINVS